MYNILKSVMSRPFDISIYKLDEIFKKNHNNWPAGAFDYQLRLKDMPEDEIETLCEWLSINCTKNYIVSKDTLQILSGGPTNNQLAWKQRNRSNHYNEKTSTIKVRLDDADITLFRMAWVS